MSVPVKFGRGQAQEWREPRLIRAIHAAVDEYVGSLPVREPQPIQGYPQNRYQDQVHLKKIPHLVTYHTLNYPTHYLLLAKVVGRCVAIYFRLSQGKIDLEQAPLEVLHRFSEELFLRRTLFQGELHKGPPDRKIDLKLPTYHFILTDLIGQDRKLNTEPFPSRITKLNQLIHMHYTPDTTLDPVRIDVKPHVEYRHLKALWNQRNHLPYHRRIRGLIFHPEERANPLLVLYPDHPEKHPKLQFPRFSAHHSKIPTELTASASTSTPAPTSSSASTPTSTPTSAPTPTPVAPLRTDIHQKLRVESTAKPDVYRIQTPRGPQLAHVPSIEVSRMLRSELQPHPKSSLYLCKFVARFKKWQPLEKIED